MQVADTRHEGKTIGRKEARKIFESVLKASKTGAKGTHVRALTREQTGVQTRAH